MSTQVSFDFSLTETRAKEIKVHECFMHNGNLLMRVKPVNFLLNSDLINDCISRGRIFVANMAKGTLYTIEGSEIVVPANVKIQVEGGKK